MFRLIRWVLSRMDAEGLDPTEYIEHVGRAFGIVIPVEAAEGFKTLRDLCDYVARWRRELSDGEIWEAVRRITSEEFGVRQNELHPGIRYVEDLNC